MQNKYRIEGDKTFIECDGGIEFIIDTEDLSTVSEFHIWNVDRQNITVYTGTLHLRRLLLGLEKGDKKRSYHINFNNLDYRKRNLATGDTRFIINLAHQCNQAYKTNEEINELETKLKFHWFSIKKVQDRLKELKNQ